MARRRPHTEPAPGDEEGFLRPHLALRLGVLATDESADAASGPAFDDVLARIRADVERIAGSARGRAFYRHDERADGELRVAPRLTAILGGEGLGDSGSAIAARLSGLGYALHVVLPIDPGSWCAAPGGNAQDRRALVAGAGDAILSLDGAVAGASALDARRARALANRLVIRNSDIALVLWDGMSSGTLDDVAPAILAALSGGVPVIHVDPKSPARWRFINTLEEFNALGREVRALDMAEEIEQLATTIQRLLSPPVYAERDKPHTHAAWWHPFEVALIGEAVHDSDPVCDVLLRSPWRPLGFFQRLFKGLRDTLGATTDPLVKPIRALLLPRPSVRPTDRLSHVDALAEFYAGAYRGTFLSIFTFGAVALSLVLASALWPQYKAVFVVIELALLLWILMLVKRERRLGYHVRWIEFRLLAEALRYDKYLAPLARRLPVRPVIAAATHARRSRDWVGWYFNAIVRQAPLARGSLAAAFAPIKAATLDDLLGEPNGVGNDQQIAYFSNNATKYGTASHRLAGAALTLFVLTGLIVLVKLVDIGSHVLERWGLESLGPWLTFATGVFPAIATALFAIRSQGEFEVLRQNGTRIAEQLTDAKDRLATLQPGVPLASEDLGRQVTEIVRILLSDVEDWALLFDVKVVEAA